MDSATNSPRKTAIGSHLKTAKLSRFKSAIISRRKTASVPIPPTNYSIRHGFPLQHFESGL
jgi:hypothetical protein